MAYVLENSGESDRLEKQAKLGAYQLSHELRFLKLVAGQKVLDAGCGTGLVARYLVNAFPDISVDGCDLSETRLQTARELSKTEAEKSVRFFKSPLENLDVPSSSYDAVTTRYVIEHLPHPQKVVNELYRVIRPGGKIYLINFDGVIYNLHPMSQELHGLVQTMIAKAPFDLYAGRKMPGYLQKAGFKKISWNVDVHGFQGEALEREHEMNAERLTFALPMLSEVFQSESKAERFKKLFLNEMLAPGSTLFYNKFIVTGEKLP